MDCALFCRSNEASDLIRHLSEVHSMTVATYLATTESAGLMSSSVEHKCRLCDKGVLQTQKTLSYHMLVKHGFDLEDYYEVSSGVSGGRRP